VKGLDRLKRQLRALYPQQIEASAEALDEGATEMADAIRRAAPKRHGALQKSVGQALTGQVPAGAKLAAQDATAGQALKASARLSRTVYAGDDEAYYARWVEFGTAERGPGVYRDKKGKRRNAGAEGHHATPAEPFFFPTVRALKRRVKSRMTRAGSKAAKAAAATS
jgi:HK97 gp10 family phage protein